MFQELWTDLGKDFLAEFDQVLKYGDLIALVTDARERLGSFSSGCAFLVEADNTSDTYIKFISLLEEGHTVLLSPSYQFQDEEFLRFLETETRTNFIKWPKNAFPSLERSSGTDHVLLKDALFKREARFLVRTSGSSGGKFKFIVHDPKKFIKKYQLIGKHFNKTLAFSPAESIAGIETLLEVLTHQVFLAATGDRLNPALVVDLLSNLKIDYFQTTPTFLNLLAVSGQMNTERLSSLRKIAYGSEPSQKTVLVSIKDKLPAVELMHTYGMSEIGIQKTKTNGDDPTTFQFNDDFNPGRLIEGMLEVRSLTPMLGYLNSDVLLFSGEWFRTLDRAVPETTFFRVLGREGDLINMAGRKFFPSELEELIMNLDGVLDVTVIKEANEIIGNVLMARIFIDPSLDETSFRAIFKKYCQEKIPYFMHPHKVVFSKEAVTHPRFKKVRRI